MRFTLEHYNALCDAIASGASSVVYSGKSVTYRSMQDMIELAKLMEEKLGLSTRKAPRRLVYKNPRFR